MNSKPTIYKIKAVELFKCPICHWRVSDSKDTKARTEMRWHMKHEHQIGGNQVRLLKPCSKALSRRPKIRNCPVCGNPFADFDNGRTKTCSRACGFGKHYILRTPSGETHRVRNLRKWCRDHQSLFPPDNRLSSPHPYALRAAKALTLVATGHLPHWKNWEAKFSAKLTSDTTNKHYDNTTHVD